MDPVEHLPAALDGDPGFALAHAWLSYVSMPAPPSRASSLPIRHRLAAGSLAGAQYFHHEAGDAVSELSAPGPMCVPSVKIAQMPHPVRGPRIAWGPRTTPGR